MTNPAIHFLKRIIPYEKPQYPLKAKTFQRSIECQTKSIENQNNPHSTENLQDPLKTKMIQKSIERLS